MDHGLPPWKSATEGRDKEVMHGDTVTSYLDTEMHPIQAMDQVKE